MTTRNSSELGSVDSTTALNRQTDAEAERQASARRYHVFTVPVIRILAVNSICVGVLLHHWLIGPAVSQSSLIFFLLAVEIYCFGSWLMLLTAWDWGKGGPDAQSLMLALDVAVCVIATYVTGAERSWLFFLIVLRLSDSSLGLRRTLALAHLAPLLYVAMLWYVAGVDGRAVPLGPAAVITFALYGTALYFALIGRTAVSLRERVVSAVRVSRDLIGQLEQKSEELKRSVEKAGEASRAKALFLSTISHELRTPLTTIIGQTEMVMDEADPRRDAALIRDLEEVVTAARQLSGVVDDLLEVSRIDGDEAPIHLEPVDTAALVRDVTARMQAAVMDNGNAFDVVYGELGTMRTDRSRLRRVLLILLGNAAKFTSHGKVTLDVRRVDGYDGSAISFRISDTGIGIADEIRPRLFTPFAQGDSSTTRKYGGAGLGLVIAKRYAELMAADLSYDTTPGVGTTFTLVVPTIPDTARSASGSFPHAVAEMSA